MHVLPEIEIVIVLLKCNERTCPMWGKNACKMIINRSVNICGISACSLKLVIHCFRLHVRVSFVIASKSNVHAHWIHGVTIVLKQFVVQRNNNKRWKRWIDRKTDIQKRRNKKKQREMCTSIAWSYIIFTNCN